MRALFNLKPNESKRLIAKAVIELPAIKTALKQGKIAVAGGTTNGYIAEEFINRPMEKGAYTAGIITDGVQCTTASDKRVSPMILENGKVKTENLLEAVKDFDSSDVFIKGANALDPDYNAGVMLGSDVGGTISVYPLLAARGCHLVIPVGREKLIPSVRDAANTMGINKFDKHIGMACGMIQLSRGQVITEVEALQILFNVTATHVASGGVGGSDGSCSFTIEGEDLQVEKAFKLIKKLKKEPELTGEKKNCGDCPSPCDR